jgi:hypothetical protein
MRRLEGYVETTDNLVKCVGSKIDLFISSTGWEERCSQGWGYIKGSNVKTERKIIFFFDEVVDWDKEHLNPDGLSIAERDPSKHFEGLFDLTHEDCKLPVGLYDEISGLSKFKECLGSPDPGMRIVMDFSVMIKPYSFVLLKYLFDVVRVDRICLLYTEPESYHKKRKKTTRESDEFTSGTLRVCEIPGYSGIKNLSKRTALVILLGFEGGRAIQVNEAVDPDITIPVNGFPAYRPEFKDMSLVRNEELLREDEIFKNLRYAPASDPFSTKRALNDIYGEKSSRFNLSIAPLGSKPMAIGACLFALEKPECSLVYPYPEKYSPKSGSGCGRTWIYSVSRLEGLEP